MKIDLYVKVCLTVIAVSLGTIAFKDFAKPAHAQTKVQWFQYNIVDVLDAIYDAKLAVYDNTQLLRNIEDDVIGIRKSVFSIELTLEEEK